MMEIDDKNVLKEFCEKFCNIVEGCCKYIIVSGYVAIASGRTRGTEDIDMIIEYIAPDTFFELHDKLIKSGFECIQSSKSKTIYEYLSNYDSVRYSYKGHIVPQMEVKFAKDNLDKYQLQNRKKLILTGIDVWFSSIEMNIAFKEEYLKSDKDIEDATHLRLVYDVDENEIKSIKEQIRKYRL